MKSLNFMNLIILKAAMGGCIVLNIDTLVILKKSKRSRKHHWLSKVCYLVINCFLLQYNIFNKIFIIMQNIKHVFLI